MLLTGDLAEYERDPGLYLDYRTEMIGTQVTDTDGVIEAIVTGRFDLTGYGDVRDRRARAGAREVPASGSSTGSWSVRQRLRGEAGTLPPDVRPQ